MVGLVEIYFKIITKNNKMFYDNLKKHFIKDNLFSKNSLNIKHKWDIILKMLKIKQKKFQMLYGNNDFTMKHYIKKK